MGPSPSLPDFPGREVRLQGAAGVTVRGSAASSLHGGGGKDLCLPSPRWSPQQPALLPALNHLVTTSQYLTLSDQDPCWSGCPTLRHPCCGWQEKVLASMRVVRDAVVRPKAASASKSPLGVRDQRTAAQRPLSDGVAPHSRSSDKTPRRTG